jgi:hypothetical protein
MQHGPHSDSNNPEQIEKDARVLLHAFRRRETDAIRRFYSIDPMAGSQEPRLADAQYVVARERGFISWRRLKERSQL